MVKKYWVYNDNLEEEGNEFTDYEGSPLTKEQLEENFTEVVKLSELKETIEKFEKRGFHMFELKKELGIE